MLLSSHLVLIVQGDECGSMLAIIVFNMNRLSKLTILPELGEVSRENFSGALPTFSGKSSFSSWGPTGLRNLFTREKQLI